MDGDRAQTLVLEHLEHVKFLARKLIARLPTSVDLEDLISEGTLGLMDAARKFDPARDNTFKTYAEFRINGAMIDFLREQDWLPRSARDQIKALERATLFLEESLQREPTAAELAEHLDIDVQKVHELLELASRGEMLSFEADCGEERDIPGIHATIDSGDPTPEELLLDRERADQVRAAGDAMSARYRHIFNRRLEGARLHEIGTELGISESRVSQVFDKVERHARSFIMGIYGKALTEKELQLKPWLDQGLTQGEIAKKLGWNQSQVCYYARQITEKTTVPRPSAPYHAGSTSSGQISSSGDAGPFGALPPVAQAERVSAPVPTKVIDMRARLMARARELDKQGRTEGALAVLWIVLEEFGGPGSAA